MKIRHLPLLLMLVLFTGSCEMGDPGNDNPPSTLKTDKTEISTYQAVSVTTENITLKKESYEGTFGGKVVVLGADRKKGILAFLVPAIEEGRHTLSINLEGQDFQIAFMVKVTQPAAPPDVVIAKAIEEVTFTNAELDNIQLKMKGLEGTEYAEENTAMLKQYTQSVLQTIAGLSQEQKKELAAFITANPVLFTPAEDPTKFMDGFSFRKDGETPEQILDALFVRMEKDKDDLYAIAVITLGAGIAGQPWLAAITGLAGIYKIYDLNNKNIAGLDKALMRFGEMLMGDIDAKKTGSNFRFYKDRKYLITVKSPYRNPNASDMQATSVLMQGVIVSLNEVGEVWIEANKFISKFGFSLKGNAHHIKYVSKTKSKIQEVNPELLAIANISNPKVKGKWDLSAEGWLLEFTTEETAPQEFTFDIMYKSVTAETVLKYEATLDPISKMFGWYVGKYELFPYNNASSHVCSPQAGDKGDVFFYFTPTKLVTYSRSILEGIPDLYDKSDGPFYPKFMGANKDSLQFRHTGNLGSDYQLPGGFDLDYLNIFPGTVIKNSFYSDGWAYMRTDYGKGCDGPNSETKYIYDMNTNAAYQGEIPPSGLSAAELKKIMEL